jgi:hypothetical protein
MIETVPPTPPPDETPADIIIDPPSDIPALWPADNRTLPPTPDRPLPASKVASPPSIPLPALRETEPPTEELTPALIVTSAPTEDTPEPALSKIEPAAPNVLEPVDNNTFPDDEEDEEPELTLTSPEPPSPLDNDATAPEELLINILPPLLFSLMPVFISISPALFKLELDSKEIDPPLF